MLPHLSLHIYPRSEYTLAPDIRLLIKKTVQDLDTEMRHTYLVCIGEAKREPDVHIALVLDHLAQLTPDIAAGLLNLQKQFFYFFRIHKNSYFFNNRTVNKYNDIAKKE